MPVVPTRWPHSLCADVSLSLWHIFIDEGTPPSTKPLKDWTPGHPGQSVSSSWYWYQNHLFISYPISGCKKPGSHVWWPIMPPTTLHPSLGCAALFYTTSRKSGLTWLSPPPNSWSRPRLSLSSNTGMLFWRAFLCAQWNSYGWSRTQQPACSSISPKCHSTAHQPTLATHGCLNQFQVTNTAFRVTSGSAPISLDSIIQP